MKREPLKVASPAKIILTGEHSVVYGMPAIVTAINRFAYTEIAATATSRIHLTLADLKEKASSTFDTLRLLRDRLLESYHLCLNGSLSIRQVLQRPAELFQFTLINLIDTFQTKIKNGLKVKVHSEIPIGCGMGSSAATIVSVIRAFTHYLNLDINLDWLYRLSVEAERLQHGFSSGIDSYISLNGGAARFQNGKAHPLLLPEMPLYIVNTGKPESSTGECVMNVASRFKTSTIWKEFEAVTNHIERALGDDLAPLIRHNHELLTHIGVVPTKVQQFIKELEEAGASAKTCGAGAVYGESAGIVLVLADEPPLHICQKYGYTISEVKGEKQGARVV
ncbi:MAG: mevalonate kinase [Verrucomicrobia bacterium]|nr:mevalonate kinase [Verrucomicrobiota bacterium]